PIKSFTALAGMNAGVIDVESPTLCRGRFSGESIDVVCSHPKSKAPFNLAQALAYSCNYFFATLSGRLSFDSLKATLASAGFGARAGVNAGGEASGGPPGGGWGGGGLLGGGGKRLGAPSQVFACSLSLWDGGPRHSPP